MGVWEGLRGLCRPFSLAKTRENPPPKTTAGGMDATDLSRSAGARTRDDHKERLYPPGSVRNKTGWDGLSSIFWRRR